MHIWQLLFVCVCVCGAARYQMARMKKKRESKMCKKNKETIRYKDKRKAELLTLHPTLPSLKGESSEGKHLFEDQL